MASQRTSPKILAQPEREQKGRKLTDMPNNMKIPVFASESEEAKWWVNQEDSIADEFEKAAAQGQVARGTAVRRAAIPTTTIRLDPKDIERARKQADRKGLRYQTYLKMLIHEALASHEVPNK
jgi:predicted DNA binding CopG/RHH family protein